MNKTLSVIIVSVTYTDSHILAVYTECHYAECRYAECHYAECHGAESYTHIR